MAGTFGVNFFFTCTSINLFLGVPANITVLIYLICGVSARQCATTRLMYRSIVVTDLLFAVSVSPFSLQQLTGVELYSQQALCEVIEFSIDSLSRLIYLLMSLLSVVRARAISKPLAPITFSRLKRVLLGMIALIVLECLVPVIIRQFSEKALCGGGLPATFPNKTIRKLWQALGVLFPVGVAVLTMLGANAVSLYHLLKSSELVNLQNHRARCKAAKTTLMLTMVFFCLHITGIVKMLGDLMEIGTNIDGHVANGLMFLSASFDPFVYFLKTPAIWRFWKKTVTGVRIYRKGSYLSLKIKKKRSLDSTTNIPENGSAAPE